MISWEFIRKWSKWQLRNHCRVVTFLFTRHIEKHDPIWRLQMVLCERSANRRQDNLQNGFDNTSPATQSWWTLQCSTAAQQHRIKVLRPGHFWNIYDQVRSSSVNWFDVTDTLVRTYVHVRLYGSTPSKSFRYFFSFHFSQCSLCTATRQALLT